MKILKSIFGKYKQKLPPEAQADILLSSAINLAKNEIENHKDKLTGAGFTTFDATTYLELTNFYCFLAMEALDNSPIPHEVKNKIRDGFFKSYSLWTQLNIKDKKVINDVIEWMKESFKDYQIVYKMSESGLRNNPNMLSLVTDIAKALTVIWQNYLKRGLDPDKNIFDALPLFTFYFDSVMALIPSFADSICMMNLSKEEYQKQKDFLELMKNKFETMGGRREIDKVLKAVEEYRKK